jgi:hypothetical protein
MSAKLERMNFADWFVEYPPSQPPMDWANAPPPRARPGSRYFVWYNQVSMSSRPPDAPLGSGMVVFAWGICILYLGWINWMDGTDDISSKQPCSSVEEKEQSL